MSVQRRGSEGRRRAAGPQGPAQPSQSAPASAAVSAAAPVVVVAVMAFLVTGCSADLGFPSIHDMPPPRADTPLTPDQIKLETNALISDRDHLATQTRSGVQPAVSKTPLPPPVQADAQAPAADASQTTGAVAKP